jgi:multiple sugar transport system substrate-binding protein
LAAGARAAFDSPVNIRRSTSVWLSKASLLGQDDRPRLHEGRVGMMISGAWNLRTIAERARISTGAWCLAAAGAAGMPPSPAEFRELRRPHPRAAELARFLIERDNAVALCRAARSVHPAARGAEDDPYYRQNPRDRLFIEQLRTAVAPPPHPSWIEIEEILDREIEEALYGRKSAAEAVKAASERIDRFLAEGGRS